MLRMNLISHEEEYQHLIRLSGDRTSNMLNYVTGRNPENKCKNRYVNILPLEESIVSLKDKTYINANYVLDKRYISTQAPLRNTIDDFWKMIWECNVNTIVMLTDFVENDIIKADVYWPNILNNTIKCGEYIVKYVSIETINNEKSEIDYLIRTFIITNEDPTDVGSKASSSESRYVYHYHYLKWGDSSVPKDNQSLLNMIKRLNIHSITSPQRPIVVHCSAGVGRTGAFIAIHYLISLKRKERPSIFEIVRLIRKERESSVTTLEQYSWIYNFLKEYDELVIH